MAIPPTPFISDTPPAFSIQTIQGTVVQLTGNVTNTATTATQITGMTNTFVIQPGTKYLIFTLNVDNATNSGSNGVVFSIWRGVVGSGTQIAQTTNPTAVGCNASFIFVVPSSLIGTSQTFNVGMNGAGAGTNTLVAGTTNPANFYIEAV